MKRLAWISKALLPAALVFAPAGALAQSDTTKASEPLINPDTDLLPITTGPTDDMLRVCSDPNNMPFSNRKGEGFENKIAELIAKDWGKPLAYSWWPARRGFVRGTLSARRCDVVIGVPAGYDPVASTRPYYRSAYVLIYPASKSYDIKSFDDPLLKKLRIGVNLIGDDYANPPPVQVLAQHGVHNLKGYSVFGDYSKESPPHEIVEAVANGEVDAAIVWGPMAGYYVKRSKTPLKVSPLPPSDDPNLPFDYNVAMGVRRADKALQAKLEETLERRKEDIRKILDEYGVPLLPVKASPEPARDDDD
jgi:mxaJ protein